MIDLNKERETVHNAINTLFDIAKVQKAEIDLLNINIANKQSEIDEIKAKLEAAQVPEGFVLMPMVPSQAMVDAVRKCYEGESYLPYSLYSEFVNQAIIEAAQENEDE